MLIVLLGLGLPIPQALRFTRSEANRLDLPNPNARVRNIGLELKAEISVGH